jgi:hypothetical protein
MTKVELLEYVEKEEINLPILIEYKSSRYHNNIFYSVVMNKKNINTLSSRDSFNLVDPFLFNNKFLSNDKDNKLTIMTSSLGTSNEHAQVCRYPSEISHCLYTGSKLATGDLLKNIFLNLTMAFPLRLPDINFDHSKIIFDNDIKKWIYAGIVNNRAIFINDSNECLQIEDCDLNRFFYFEKKYSFNEIDMAKAKYDKLLKDAEFIKKLYKFDEQKEHENEA